MGLFDDLLPAQAAPARPPIPAAGRALLDTIAGSESPGYNTLYGGGTFEGTADHPRQAIPITSGPNAGRTSSAAGRYQFLGSTWDEVKKEAGLPDFSPDSQDQGAWYLAQKTYKAKTGRELASDLESAQGNPNAVQAIGKQLSGVWTSLPGGIEPNKATGSFAQRYDGAGRPSTEMSSQARRPTGLFDDLLPAPSQPAPGPPATADLPVTGGRFTDNPGQNFRTAREGTGRSMGRLEAFGTAMANSGTANFFDELMGATAAGTAGMGKTTGAAVNAVPYAPQVLGLARLGYEALMGQPGDATAAYEKIRDRERERMDQAQQQYPGTALAGTVAGGLATAPLGAEGLAARGVGLGVKALQSAKTGAVLGAAGGAGEGTSLGDRAAKAATGGVTGAIIGAAAAPVVEGVVQIGRAASAAARPLTTAVRGIFNPEAEAARRTVTAIERDQRVGQGLAPQEWANAGREGAPVTNMDLGGDATRSLARSAANTSPEGKAALDTSINGRFESQSPRISDYIRSLFGGGIKDVEANRETLQAAARQANKPAYAKAYSSPNAQSLWDEGFEQIAQAPVVQDAIKGATRTGANRAAAEGFTPVRNPFAFDEATQRMVLKDANTKPNLQFWDHVKRNLDDTISTLDRAGEKSAAADAKALRAQLTQRLDDAVPDFKTARAGAARFFGAEDALDAGKQFVRSNQNLDEARRAFAQLKGPEKELFQQGFVSGLLDDLGRVADRRNVLNTISQTPGARAKLEMVLGPEKWAQLEGRLRVEGIMDLARSAVQGNSTTARQLFELGAAGGVGGYQQMSGDPTALGGAVATWALLRGHRAIDARVARRVGEMLASNDPQVLQKGLAIVTRNRNMMDALRSADVALGRVGTEQARTAIPAIQGPAPGRAEDQQPQ